MSIKLLGRAAADGTSITLLEPTAMTITRAYDSPAEMLEITFPHEGAIPDLTDIQVSHDQDILFRGYCDEIIRAVDDGGATVTINARSPGALLLDNEAKPASYQNITARVYFNEVLGPFGFKALTVPDEAKKAVSYTVPKGRSVWEAFSQLCFLLYGREPYLNDRMELRVEALPSAATMLVNNDPAVDAARYCSLEYITRRSSAISHITFKDQKGGYTQLLKNPFGNPLKVNRGRYVIPAPEFSATVPSLDAYQRIIRGERGVHSIALSLPKLYNIHPGRMIGVVAPLCGEQLMAAFGVKIIYNYTGCRTRVVLADPVYL